MKPVVYPSGTIRSSVVTDAARLEPILRMEDRRECLTIRGPSTNIQEVLERGIESSFPSYTLESPDGNRIICILGTVPHWYGSPVGAVWMVGSSEIEKIVYDFVRNSAYWVSRLFDDKYDVLLNSIDSRNTLHLRWLKWLGFKFIGQHLVSGINFYEFLKTRI